MFFMIVSPFLFFSHSHSVTRKGRVSLCCHLYVQEILNYCILFWIKLLLIVLEYISSFTMIFIRKFLLLQNPTDYSQEKRYLRSHSTSKTMISFMVIYPKTLRFSALDYYHLIYIKLIAKWRYDKTICLYNICLQDKCSFLNLLNMRNTHSET